MKKYTLALLLLMVAVVAFPNGKKKEKQIMDSWLGSTKHALIIEWGPPQQTTSDGDGGEVLIYCTRVYIPATNYGMGLVSATDYYKNRMFYIHSNGVIYSWRTSATSNPPTQVDVYLH